MASRGEGTPFSLDNGVLNGNHYAPVEPHRHPWLFNHWQFRGGVPAIEDPEIRGGAHYPHFDVHKDLSFFAFFCKGVLL